MAAMLTMLLVLLVPQNATNASHSQWSLQADPASCVLQRRNVDPPSVFSVDTVPGSDSYRVYVASKDIPILRSAVPASLTFLPSNKDMNGFARSAKLSDGTPILSIQGLDPTILDNLAGAKTVTVVTRSKASGSVTVPGAPKAVLAFRRCNADQLIEWGADPSQFAAGGSSPAALKPRDRLFSDSDLMTIIGRSKRSEIDATFRVGITTTGIIDSCAALSPATEKGVEEAVCTIVKKDRLFDAAKGPDGAPVRGVATISVVLMRRPG